VQTYKYNNPSWTAGSSGIVIDMSGILTTTIIENDVILSYIKHIDVDLVGFIPGAVWVGSNYRNYPVIIDPVFFDFLIVSLEMDGSFTPNSNLAPVEWIKVIIIDTSNTTVINGNGRSASPQQVVLDELAAAGVDVTIYKQVAAYYGLQD